MEKKTMIIKSITVLIMFAGLCLSLDSHAQSDRLTYSTESGQDSLISYLTPMEYAFMFHEETNWLLKVNLLVATEVYTGVNLKLSLEKEIATGFSINAMIGASNLYTFLNNSDGIHNYRLEGSIESRWYYQTRKNIRTGKAASGLSGTYLALGAGYRVYMQEDNSVGSFVSPDYLSVFGKWGIQRRFLKHGYIDFGVKGGYNNAIPDVGLSYGFLETYVDAGLAFTHDKQKLDYAKLCPVLKCQAADKFLLKTNLVDVVSLATIRKTLISSVSPNIAAEFKLGTSPFSINTQLGSRVEYVFSTGYDYSAYIFSPEVLLEGRYYYNLNRRILTGKTGNGLSANYVSLGAIYQGEYQILKSNGYRSDVSKSFGGILLGTGIQRVIADHLYYDINIGLGYGTEFEYNGLEGTKKWDHKSIFNLGIAIGYRF